MQRNPLHPTALFALLALLTFTLTACDTVTSPHPIGEPIADKEAEKLNGVWRAGDGVLHVKHIEDGRFQVANVEWEDGQFALEKHTVIVTESNGARYVNLTSDDETEQARDHQFLRITASNDDTLVAVLPNVEVFAQAVRNGELPGEVSTEQQEDQETTHVSLGDDREAIERFIKPNRVGEQFRLDASFILHRIAPLPREAR